MLDLDSNKRINTKLDESVSEVKKISNSFYDDKMRSVKEDFESFKKICNELDDTKLQNEKLERLIHELEEEKEELNEKISKYSLEYDSIMKKFNDTKKLLEQSHFQNKQLSDIIEKMRNNEKQLMSENERLRKNGVSRSGDKKETLQNNININTILDLEKELKYWKDESERISQLLKQNPNQNQIKITKTSKNKTSGQIKRHGKSVSRTTSIESSFKKSNENEYAKLKEEKNQMKNLLNNLEKQIIEIQENVVKINDERQKYKEMFYESKYKLEHIHGCSKETECRVVELNNHNMILSQEYSRLNKEKEELIQQNISCELDNKNLKEKLEIVEKESRCQIDQLKREIHSYQLENGDLTKRSTHLNLNLQQLEVQMNHLEKNCQEKDRSIKDNLTQIDELKKQLELNSKETDEKSVKINSLIDDLNKQETRISELEEIERTTEKSLSRKSSQERKYQEVIGELKKDLEKQQNDFSVQIIKFQNHIKNAEEMVGAKIKLIMSLEMKLVSYDEEIQRLNKEQCELKKELGSFQYKLDAEKQKFIEASSAKDVLERHLNSLVHNSDKQQRDLIDINLISNETRRELDRKNREINDLKVLLDERDQALLTYQASMKRLEREIEDDAEIHHKTIQELEKYNRDKSEKDQYVKQLLDIIDQKDFRIEKLHDEMRQDSERIKDLNEQVKEFEDCIVQSTSRGSALEVEVEALRKTNHRLKKQKEQANQILTERNMMIGHLKAQIKNPNCPIIDNKTPEYAFQTISDSNESSLKYRSKSFDDNKMKSLVLYS